MMAITQGHGNPNWTRDEVILALDLYFDMGAEFPGRQDERVVALSNLLRSFPYHAVAARKPSFRNADGVAFKLQNLRQVATGKGLGNVSKIDRAVWQDLGRDPGRTKALADLIRNGLKLAEDLKDDFDEKDVFSEGRVVTEAHLRREREPTLRKHLFRSRRASGELCCDLCQISMADADPNLVDSIFEVHHLVPLSAGEERNTRLEDVALLCANCHRMIHRAISIHKRWLTIEDAKTTFQMAKILPEEI